jgi:glycogen debranching enzyme
MCLMGLSSQGFQSEAMTVIEGLLKAAEHFENNRLPELFCGYPTKRGRPVYYPVACSPQAWAAGTPLVFMTSMLGIRLDYLNKKVYLQPSLPAGMNRLDVSNLKVGDGRLDIRVERDGQVYRVEIASNTSGWSMEFASLV